MGEEGEQGPQLPHRFIFLLKEYELSQKMHNYYGQDIWVIGSIFIGGGLAAIALIVSRVNPTNVMVSLVSFAVGLVNLLFYFKVRRSKKISEIHLRRCREIEQELPLSQHQYVRLATGPKGILITVSVIGPSFPVSGMYLTNEVVMGRVKSLLRMKTATA